MLSRRITGAAPFPSSSAIQWCSSAPASTELNYPFRYGLHNFWILWGFSRQLLAPLFKQKLFEIFHSIQIQKVAGLLSDWPTSSLSLSCDFFVDLSSPAKYTTRTSFFCALAHPLKWKVRCTFPVLITPRSTRTCNLSLSQQRNIHALITITCIPIIHTKEVIYVKFLNLRRENQPSSGSIPQKSLSKCPVPAVHAPFDKAHFSSFT